MRRVYVEVPHYAKRGSALQNIAAALALFSCAYPQGYDRGFIAYPKIWPEVPIQVIPHQFKGATYTAMHLWNSAAGCEIFTSKPGTTEVHIIDNNDALCGLNWHPSSHPDSGGSAYCPDRNRFEISIARPGQYFQQVVMITHELGHILNLEHDNNPRSPMHPTPSVIVRQEWIRITDKDREIVRQRYCR